MSSQKMKIYELLMKIKNTSSRDDIATILKGIERDSVEFMVLQFLLDKNITTGLKTKTIEKIIDVEHSNLLTFSEKELWEGIVGYLKINNTGRDYDALNVKMYAQAIASYNDEDSMSNIIELLCKSMKLGISEKNLNAIFPGAIISHKEKLVLAKKLEGKKIESEIFGKEIIITKKFDGIRCTVFQTDESIKFMTRQGKEIEGLVELIESFNELPNGIYDGELLINDTNEELYTSSDVTSITSTKDIVKTGLKFKCFDLLELDNISFEDKPYIERIKKVREIANSGLISPVVPITGNFTPIVVNNHDELDVYHNKAIQAHWEGLMVALADGEYESRKHQTEMNIRDNIIVQKTGLIKEGSERSNVLFKLKKKYTMDLECTDVEIAIEGEYKGMIGAIIVDFKGVKVKVGSGLSEEDRTQSADYFVGKIIEVGYLALSTNKNNPDISLKHPTFERIRDDKTIDDISYE